MENFPLFLFFSSEIPFFNRPLRFSTPSIRANDSLELRVKKIYTYMYVCREMEIETKRGNFLILTR